MILLLLILLSAVFPTTSLAAIDDQGMQYVTAAEGLHGSLRVNIFRIHREDEISPRPFSTYKREAGDSSGVSGGAENSLRLWVTGSADIGGGYSSTYYWEVRSNENGDAVGTEAFDLGITGPFGTFTAGKMVGVSDRFVPSADLAFDLGTNVRSFTAPRDSSLRYESPSFSGFELGFSVIMEDRLGNDPTFDGQEYAIKYSTPDGGFEVGASFRRAPCWTTSSDRSTFALLATTLSVGVIDTSGDTLSYDCGADGADSSRYWSVGTRYRWNNWLLGYQYIGFKNDILSYLPFSTTATGPLLSGHLATENIIRNRVHSVGVQVKLGQFTPSLSWSREELSADSSTDIISGGTLFITVPARYTLNQNTVAADVAYALGSRSTVVFGHRVIAKRFSAQTLVASSKTPAAEGITYLFYRVDF